MQATNFTTSLEKVSRNDGMNQMSTYTRPTSVAQPSSPSLHNEYVSKHMESLEGRDQDISKNKGLKRRKFDSIVAETKQASRSSGVSKPSEQATRDFHTLAIQASKDQRPRQFVEISKRKSSSGTRRRKGGKYNVDKKQRTDTAHLREALWTRAPHLSVTHPEGDTYAHAIHDTARFNGIKIKDQTQAAVNQTTRINHNAVSRAIPGEQFTVELALANARRILRRSHCKVGELMHVDAFNVCTSVLLPSESQHGVVLSSPKTACNRMPVRLRPGGIWSEAHRLAVGELDKSKRLVSSTMEGQSTALDRLCESVCRQGPWDTYWSAIVLLKYVSSHVAGRALLELDERSGRTVDTLSVYGDSEDKRRRNHEPRRQEIMSAYGRSECQGSDTDSDVFEEVTSNQGDEEEEDDYEDEDEVDTKRKRSQSSNTRDSGRNYTPATILRRWTGSNNGILTGNYMNVLQTLIADSNELVELAAIQSMEQQSPFNLTCEDEDAQAAAYKQANKTVVTIKRFLDPEDTMIPMAFACRQTEDNFDKRVVVDLFGTQIGQVSEIETVAHAVRPSNLLPPTQVGITILRSQASWHLRQPSNLVGTDLLFLDQFKLVAHVASNSNGRPGDTWNMLPSLKKHGGSCPMLPCASNLNRGWIVTKSRIRTYLHDEQVAESLAAEAMKTHDLAVSADGLFESRKDANARQYDVRPIPVPSIAVGLSINKIMRQFLVLRRREKRATRSHLGLVQCRSDVTTSDYFVGDFSPVPLLAIDDVKIERIDGTHSSDESPDKTAPLLFRNPRERDPSTEALYSVAYHVVGDGVARVLDVIEKQLLAVAHSPPSEQARALLHALELATGATIQASTVTEIAVSANSDRLNNAAASSQRMYAYDRTLLPFIGPEDVYVGGRANIMPSCEGTLWETQTGSWYDCGVTPPGINNKNYADGRGHSSMCLDQETVDELGRQFSQDRYVPTREDEHFATRPTETQGIGWGLIPHVHMALCHLDDALENTRSILGHSEDHVTELLVFPCNPNAQVSSAWCAPGAHDASDRFANTGRRDGNPHPIGRTYNSDTTDESMGIARGQRMRAADMHDVYCNPFCAPDDELTVLHAAFNYQSILARIALHVTRWHGEEYADGVDALHAVNCSFWSKTNRAAKIMNASKVPRLSSAPGGHLIAAYSSVALSAMYPSTFAVGAPMIHEVVASVAPECKRVFLKQMEAGISVTGQSAFEMSSILTPVDMERGNSWWSAYDRDEAPNSVPCTWKTSIAPLLREMISRNGTHDVTQVMADRMHKLFDRAVCGAFLANVPPGKRTPQDPCPMHDISSHEHVRRDHVESVFVRITGTNHTKISKDQWDNLVSSGKYPAPRGGVCGMKQFQWRQLLTTILASHVSPEMRTQVHRLQGQLAERISSDSCVLNKDKTERTAKGTSFIQVCKAHLSTGNEYERKEACSMQRPAWSKNAKILAPAMLYLQRPSINLSPHQTRGRAYMASELQRAAKKVRATNTMAHKTLSSHEADALSIFETEILSKSGAIGEELLTLAVSNSGTNK